MSPDIKDLRRKRRRYGFFAAALVAMVAVTPAAPSPHKRSDTYLLVLYICGAAAMAAIIQLNYWLCTREFFEVGGNWLRRGHKRWVRIDRLVRLRIRGSFGRELSVKFWDDEGRSLLVPYSLLFSERWVGLRYALAGAEKSSESGLLDLKNRANSRPVKDMQKRLNMLDVKLATRWADHQAHIDVQRNEPPSEGSPSA